MDHRDNQGIVPAAQDVEACQGRQRAGGPGSLLKASHALPNRPFPKPPDPFMSLHKSTIGWPVGILSLIESFFVCLFLLVPNLSNPLASLPPKPSLHLAPTALSSPKGHPSAQPPPPPTLQWGLLVRTASVQAAFPETISPLQAIAVVLGEGLCNHPVDRRLRTLGRKWPSRGPQSNQQHTAQVACKLASLQSPQKNWEQVPRFRRAGRGAGRGVHTEEGSDGRDAVGETKWLWCWWNLVQVFL